MTVPFLCIHGHFYQPPRENPWLDRIEVQDSAAPFHDWNERVTAECYAPMAAARILDSAGRIATIVNLYSRISFNFGPTLLSWLERHAPETYAAILKADRESLHRFSGHGAALAQAYNHTILPLASRRDKVTQVRWGIADFVHRFGRDPEGMWLPETGVDVETLEVLAEHGIRFTILAPHQARRIRRPGGTWQEVGESGVDSRRPYLIHLPSGRSLALFFYHGPVARAVAFERLLSSGEAFLARLLAIADAGSGNDQLLHIATDGETYGHHHRFGEMALAWALHAAERQGVARLSNYGEYLELHPPTWEVELAEGTSWSCAHGVERWRADCGCRLAAGTSQAWRGPLRQALEWLRDTADTLFAREGGRLFRDPWAARDAAVTLHLDGAGDATSRFLAAHCGRPLTPEETTKALRFIEMQRNAQLMFTSCGWFFDDIAGLEAEQILRYAARAAELAESLGGGPLLTELERRLAAARGNDAALPDGAEVFRRRVLSSMYTLPQLGARAALLALFPDEERPVPRIQTSLAGRIESFGRARLASGHLRLTAPATGEGAELTFAAVHFGDHTLLAGVRPSPAEAGGEHTLDDIRSAFRRADPAAVLRLIDRDMELSITLAGLPVDDRRWVLDRIVASAVEDTRAVYRTLYYAHAQLLSFTAELGVPIPPELATAAARAIDHTLAAELLAVTPDPQRLREIVSEARRLHVAPDGAAHGLTLGRALERLVAAVAESPGEVTALETLTELLRLVPELGFPVNLWQVETRYWALRQQLREGCWGSEDPPWQAAFARLGEILRFAPQLDPK